MEQPDLWKVVLIVDTGSSSRTADLHFTFNPHNILVFITNDIHTAYMSTARNIKDKLTQLYLDKSPIATISINDNDMYSIMTTVIDLNINYTVTEHEEVGLFSEEDYLQVMISR